MRKFFVLGAFFSLITGSVMGALGNTPFYFAPGKFSQRENDNQYAFSLMAALKKLEQEKKKDCLPFLNNDELSPILENHRFGSNSPIPLPPCEDTMQNRLPVRERAQETFLNASECLAFIPQLKPRITPVVQTIFSEEVPKQWGWMNDLSLSNQRGNLPFYGVSETLTPSAYTRPLAFACSSLNKLGIRAATPQIRESATLPSVGQVEKILGYAPHHIYKACLQWSDKLKAICKKEKASLEHLFQETYTAGQNGLRRFYGNNENHCSILLLFSTFFQYLAHNLQRIERDSEKVIQIFNRIPQENAYERLMEVKNFLNHLISNVNTVLKDYRSKREDFLQMVKHFECTGSIMCDKHFQSFYPQWVDALTQLYSIEEQGISRVLSNVETVIWDNIPRLCWKNWISPENYLVLEFTALVTHCVQKAKKNLAQLEVYKKPIQENNMLLNLSEIEVLTQTLGQFYRERQRVEQLKEAFFCVYHPIQEKEEIEYGPAFDMLYTQWVEEVKIWCEEKKNALQIKSMNDGLEDCPRFKDPTIQHLITQLEIAPFDLESMWQNFRENRKAGKLTREEIEYLTTPLHILEGWKQVYETYF